MLFVGVYREALLLRLELGKFYALFCHRLSLDMAGAVVGVGVGWVCVRFFREALVVV
jgi:hypothetical protein